MKVQGKIGQGRLGFITRGAIVALSASMLSACVSSGGQMWQGGDVLVEARQEVLEKDVYTVSDNHRELKDRFDALERLYVELVQSVRAQDQKIMAMQSHVAGVQKDPQVDASIKQVSNDLNAMRQQMKKLENRVYSVEVTDHTSLTKALEKAPTGTAVASAEVSPAAASTNGGTPVSQNAPMAQAGFFGVHLASYRSKDQVSSGWGGLAQSLGKNLEGLTPLIYTQSQEGIGTFLRLIAGPLMTEQEATTLCTRIRTAASEQYCRVSEYQGEPID